MSYNSLVPWTKSYYLQLTSETHNIIMQHFNTFKIYKDNVVVQFKIYIVNKTKFNVKIKCIFCIIMDRNLV